MRVTVSQLSLAIDIRFKGGNVKPEWPLANLESCLQRSFERIDASAKNFLSHAANLEHGVYVRLIGPNRALLPHLSAVLHHNFFKLSPPGLIADAKFSATYVLEDGNVRIEVGPFETHAPPLPILDAMPFGPDKAMVMILERGYFINIEINDRQGPFTRPPKLNTLGALISTTSKIVMAITDSIGIEKLEDLK